MPTDPEGSAAGWQHPESSLPCVISGLCTIESHTWIAPCAKAVIEPRSDGSAARPTPGALWRQAHDETKDLASFFRGEACRARYLDLMREHGHIVPARPGEKPATLPCGWPNGRRVGD